MYISPVILIIKTSRNIVGICECVPWPFVSFSYVEGFLAFVHFTYFLSFFFNF